MRTALTKDPAARPSAAVLLGHPWILQHSRRTLGTFALERPASMPLVHGSRPRASVDAAEAASVAAAAASAAGSAAAAPAPAPACPLPWSPSAPAGLGLTASVGAAGRADSMESSNSSRGGSSDSSQMGGGSTPAAAAGLSSGGGDQPVAESSEGLATARGSPMSIDCATPAAGAASAGGRLPTPGSPVAAALRTSPFAAAASPPPPPRRLSLPKAALLRSKSCLPEAVLPSPGPGAPEGGGRARKAISLRAAPHGPLHDLSDFDLCDPDAHVAALAMGAPGSPQPRRPSRQKKPSRLGLASAASATAAGLVLIAEAAAAEAAEEAAAAAAAAAADSCASSSAALAAMGRSPASTPTAVALRGEEAAGDVRLAKSGHMSRTKAYMSRQRGSLQPSAAVAWLRGRQRSVSMGGVPEYCWGGL